ncbi:MAG: hypothetical protein KDK41_14520 [Leptospiraceae bacterium]|nr:hypothetical protein [Leptospiraceae bacterium]
MSLLLKSIRLKKLKHGTIYFFTVIFVFAFNPLHGQQLKKVAVLDFINVTKNNNVEYLEASMTKAVDKKLSELFSYQKPDPSELRRVAEDNFLYRDDYATRSVAMNLGLLARQDVVISGGFIVKSQGGSEILVTTVRILDIPNKRVVAEFDETSKIDNTLFDSIDRIAVRISEEAKAVLPTKEEYARGGGRAPSGPWFSNWSFQFGAGAGLYMLEFADKLQAQLPSLRFGVRANMPVISNQFTMGMQALYLTDKPVAGSSPAIEGLNITTTSIMPGAYFGYAMTFGDFEIHPRFGGGYVLQSITVTGVRNENLTNMMPFGGGGFDFTYRVGRILDVTLAIDALAQFQSGKTTLLNMATVGVNFRP